jgi:hypothetical protein
MNLNKALIDQLIDDVSNYVLLNGGFSEKIGLLNGRFGLSLSMFVIGSARGKENYSEFASDLLDEIYEDIDTNIELNCEDGAIGIVIYFDLLDKYGYATVSRTDVMEEIDLMLYKQISFGTLGDITLNNGTIGVLNYLALKLKFEEENDFSEEASLTKSSIILCLDDLNDKYDQIQDLDNCEHLLASIHMLNVLNKINSDIYPQITTDLTVRILNQNVQSNYLAKIKGLDDLHEQLNYYLLWSLYNAKHIGSDQFSFYNTYVEKISSLARSYTEKPSLEVLIFLLKNLVNALYNQLFSKEDKVILMKILNELLNSNIMTVAVASTNFWLKDGLSHVLLLLNILIEEEAYGFYMDLFYLQYEY